MPIETSSKRSLAVEIVTIVTKCVDFKETLASQRIRKACNSAYDLNKV